MPIMLVLLFASSVLCMTGIGAIFGVPLFGVAVVVSLVGNAFRVKTERRIRQEQTKQEMVDEILERGLVDAFVLPVHLGESCFMGRNEKLPKDICASI